MKLLVLLSRVPYPLEKGDKLRAYNQIKELSKKHQIILFALNDSHLDDKAITELRKYCIDISIVQLSKLRIFFNLLRTFFNGKPFQVGYFYFNKAQKKLNDLVSKHHPDHIYCQLIRTSEYVKEFHNIPKTLDYMDVFSKGMELRESTASFYLKSFFKNEYNRLLRYENEVFSYFEIKTIISEQDKNFIPHPQKDDIAVIPNGVDVIYFKPIEHKKEFELLFNGNMNYPPNVESVEYLVKKIMPLVWGRLPNVRLLISGANPSHVVSQLASDKVIVSGWVEDIRMNFAKSKILVAPMQISIGLQNKLLEAMAMQLPCITSSLANNALGAKVNEQILVADAPEQYADHIIELLQNEEKYSQIALSGYAFVTNKFKWETTTDMLSQLISKSIKSETK